MTASAPTDEPSAQPEKDSNDEWPAWATDTRPENLEPLQPLFGTFVSWIERHAKPVWRGEAGLTLDPKEHAKLYESVRGRAHSAAEELTLTDWWDRLITAGNHAELWTIPLLAPVMRLPPVRPAFVRRDFQLLQDFRAFEKALRHRLLDGISKSRLFDALLCSALTYGGLFDVTALAALMQAGASSISGEGGRLRVMLDLRYAKGQFRKQRWYPDALTAALLVRALRDGLVADASGIGEIDEKAVSDRVDVARRALDLPYWRGSGREFLRAARVAQALEISPYLIAYLGGDHISHALPDPVLRRLCGWEAKAAEPIGVGAEENPASTHPPFLTLTTAFDSTTRPVDQLGAMKSVYALLAKGGDVVTALDGFLAQQGTSLWPVTALLVEWAKWRVGAHDVIEPVRPSSVRRYLGAIARHLIDAAEDENLLELDPEDFETLYELAGAKVKGEKERGVFWQQIRSFHDFLYLAGAPEIDLKELDGFVGSGSGSVSANLVGEKDFMAFKEALIGDDKAPIDESRLRIFLVGMLGFRCGLRRREIQMFWIDRIHPGADPYLIIKPSYLATLKSPSSDRRIPLRYLIPDDELQLLLDFAEKRRSILGAYKGLLFALPHAPRVPLTSAALFDPVTELFQAIIGLDEPRFRFHHLRHSFANWLLLALLAADQPELIDRDFPLLKSPLLEAPRIAALKDGFFPRLPGTPPAPTRRNLYLVSALLGHLSPATTLRSYIHVLDWLAGRECDLAVQRRLGTVGARALGAICGLSPSMPHKAPYRDLVERPMAFLRRFIELQLPRDLREKFGAKEPIPNLGEIVARIGQEPSPHPTIMMILLGRVLSGAAIGHLGKTHGIPADAMAEACEAFHQMYAKQSVKTPKENLRPPVPPRTAGDRKEFWRVIDTAYASYRDARNRPAMAAAADALIRRTGPRTGKIYVGREAEEALAVLDGLACMGIPPEVMRLVVRTPPVSLEERPEVDLIVDAFKKRGVTVETENLEWPLREAKGALLRLDVTFARHDQPDKMLKRQVGRIRGLNYAAVWVRFAANIRPTGERP